MGYIFIGVGSVVLGLLPWFVTGMRLPLQNLWGVQALPEQMPRTLLPFSQYELSSILGMVISGMGLAGLSVRPMPIDSRSKAAAYAGIGTFAACGVAIIQTSLVLRDGLRFSFASTAYFLAVLAVIILAVAGGLLVLLSIALGGPLSASLGMALAALAVGIWVRYFILGVATVPSPASLLFLVGATRWLPALLVGAALAWCGLGTLRQGVAWVVNLLLLWVVPAALAGLSNAAGSRILAGDFREMASAGVGAFLSSLGSTAGSLGPVVVAVVVAVAVLYVLSAVATGKRPAPQLHV